MYYGEDEGGDEEVDAKSPGGIVIEALSNIRTVASLNLEEERTAEYAYALEKEDPHPIKSNIVKGMTSPSDAELLIYSYLLSRPVTCATYRWSCRPWIVCVSVSLSLCPCRISRLTLTNSASVFPLVPNPAARWYVAGVEFP